MMVALISLLSKGISKKDTPKISWIKSISKLFGNVNERDKPKCFLRKGFNTLKVRKRLGEYTNKRLKSKI